MRVGVVGATGYVGAELVRWVLAHPELALVTVVSTSRAGEALGDAVPALYGLTGLVLAPFDAQALDALDVVFFATPHGAAKPLIDQLSRPIVVDASSDHRNVPGWIYGQPELAGERLPGARRISAPGCFATAMELALGPFVKAGLLRGPVAVTGFTGSAGSGATPSAGTHHPERFANAKAYKVFRHQHVAEVTGFLATLGGSDPSGRPAAVLVPAIRFVPVSAPFDRGIFATVTFPVEGDAGAVIRDAYAGRRLVRLRAETPEVRHVRGTALADLAVHQDGDAAVVLVAIDNLGKGAAAQAVQALNVSLGLPEHTGLLALPTTP